MADCECLNKCIFFNDKMANKPGTAEMYKSKYCKGDNTHCARYQVFKALGREKVPADLFPSQENRVEKIVAGG